jgi:tRNA (guanosine-2'-O-)-methyltransferase
MNINENFPEIKLKQELISYLYGYITENKRKKIEEISAWRTKFLTIVLEDIAEPKDASAVIRTCECFGIQEINIIENQNRYRINPDVTLGSSKWIDIKHFKSAKFKPNTEPLKEDKNTLDCINYLREANYQLFALTTNDQAVSLEELPLDHKIALIFGSEHNSLSPAVIQNADRQVKIPCFGLGKSYNLSVSAAISLHYLISNLIKREQNFLLAEEELLDLRLDWVKKVIKKAVMLEQKFLANKIG